MNSQSQDVYKSFDELVVEAQANEGALIVDVRTPAEFDHGHVKGACNIPFETLESFEEIVPNHDAVIYLYCEGGVLSAQATHYLHQQGYSNAINMGGLYTYSGEITSES